MVTAASHRKNICTVPVLAGSAISTVCSLRELLAAAAATCVSGLANLAGEGDAGDGLYPGDVVVDEDLTAGIPQLTPGQRPE